MHVNENHSESWHLYAVNPDTWEVDGEIGGLVSAKVNRNVTTDQVMSGTVTVDGEKPSGYVRLVLVTLSNESQARMEVATLHVGTVRKTTDGVISTYEATCYSVLTPARFTVRMPHEFAPKGCDPVAYALDVLRDACAAPVANVESGVRLFSNYVPEGNETALTFARKLVDKAGYVLDIDGHGTVSAKPRRSEPKLEMDALHASVVAGEMTDELDLYEIPNVVIAKDQNGNVYRAVNDDGDSDTSVGAVGFEKQVLRSVTLSEGETLIGKAYDLLDDASSSARRLTYTRDFDSDVREGDIVRICLPNMGIDGDYAIVSQEIGTDAGAAVMETVELAVDTFRR